MSLSQFPFESTEEERIRWLLQRVMISVNGISMKTYLYTSFQNAELIKAWLKEHAIPIPCEIKSAQMRVSFGRLFIVWLAKQIIAYNISTSLYQERRNQAQAQIEMTKNKIEVEKTRLMELLFLRDGRQGCCICGENNLLEFVHIEVNENKCSAVDFLSRCQWERAEKEALLCQVYCVKCRRERGQTFRKKTQYRKPFDAKLEPIRAASREQNHRHAAHGKKRLEETKLAYECCDICKRPVTLETLSCFEFDHLNLAEKRYCISAMGRYSDAVFETELKKCRLLCHQCHREITKKQHENGVVAANMSRMRNNKRKFEEFSEVK